MPAQPQRPRSDPGIRTLPGSCLWAPDATNLRRRATGHHGPAVAPGCDGAQGGIPAPPELAGVPIRADMAALALPLAGMFQWLDTPAETRTNTMDAGCHGTLFLSRSDLRELDEYAHEFGELITRFLKIVFLSILWSQKEAGARETLGLRMVNRYLQTFQARTANPSASPTSASAARNFIAALWEEGRMFNSDGLRSMRLVLPHLDRALRLQMRLKEAGFRAGRMSGALDCLTLGVVLVNRSGLPLWHNRRAQEVMDGSSSLRLSSAGLVGRTAAHTCTLRELIEEAVSSGTQGFLAIQRGASLRPLLLVAIPLKTDGAAVALDCGDQDVSGVLFISDPDRDDAPVVEPLRQAFDLTHREAQMAIAIARGKGLKTAARTMGIAPTTARTQLQRAFAKTGTSQQAELAALVHKTLTQIRHD